MSNCGCKGRRCGCKPKAKTIETTLYAAVDGHDYEGGYRALAKSAPANGRYVRLVVRGATPVFGSIYPQTWRQLKGWAEDLAAAGYSVQLSWCGPGGCQTYQGACLSGECQ